MKTITIKGLYHMIDKCYRVKIQLFCIYRWPVYCLEIIVALQFEIYVYTYMPCVAFVIKRMFQKNFIIITKFRLFSIS